VFSRLLASRVADGLIQRWWPSPSPATSARSYDRPVMRNSINMLWMTCAAALVCLGGSRVSLGGSTDDAPPSAPEPSTPAAPAPAGEKYPPLTAIIETSRGVIKIDLGTNDVPRLVAHFVNLADRKFYDGLVVHALSAGMQVHSGDPSGTGDGGCGYTLPKLFDRDMLYAKAGVLGLWTTGAEVSSQFFITLAPNPAKYNLLIPGIGHVVEGLDVAKELRKGDTVTTIRIEGDIARLKAAFASDLSRWNAVLDRQPPRAPAALPDPTGDASGGAADRGRRVPPPSRERPRPVPPATPPAAR